ncbi:O-antigen ligase family protein [Arthrobacter sp. H14]|uniref:O-antigen ligase family protein n=1 Tax=Arthrobacter sp. H14 TaxID=1312959 RepID=UPI00138AD11A|nr:O-antigen ligase family protein [Arthrobacter sp. H14]
MAWPAFALIMVMALSRTKNVRAPRGFGLWLLFMLWTLCTVAQVHEPGRIAGFFFRYGLYVGATVFFIYVYNARRTLTARRILGILTAFWLIVVAGGYAGIAFPVLEIRTALSFLLPDSLLGNNLIHEMAFRGLTQFNPDPDAFVVSAPRPSAPFLYTNSWGNAYSLLIPVVLAYMSMVRREKKFWFLVLILPVSFVPAFLTLNRGMFLGLGVALIYVAVRAALAGNTRIILSVAAIAIAAGIAVSALPVMERLDQRTENVSSIETRADLYVETFERTLESPVFGYGAPRPSENPGAPSAGTQGHVWIVMFSHGFPGLALFMGWLLWLFLKTIRRRDLVGLVCNTVILISLVEVFYYGVLGAGLVIIMTAGALGLREQESQSDIVREGADKGVDA